VNPIERAVQDLGRMVNRPFGTAGRYRPLYALNALDRLRGRSLEGAVRDKVLVVTGASSGIGEATARRLALAGGTVVLVARGAERLAQVRDEIVAGGGQADVAPGDLSDLEDIDRLAAEVLDRHGRVDVLVNNAGRSIRRSLDLSYDRFHDFERTMQLNYFGAVRLILAVLPSMRARHSGHIVNVSSVGVQAAVPRFAAYVASKAALDAFSECAQAEVHADGVRFTTVYMPLVRTPMIEPTRIYQSLPAIEADDAASMLCDAVTYRPRHLGTVVGTAAAMSNAVAPWAADAVRGMAYQLFPESAAARGTAATEDERPSNPLAPLFGRAFPGIHW
jgi:NAD(P)-dependent dehydrogenase (short-subunit alcohol dehydrogenase family)